MPGFTPLAKQTHNRTMVTVSTCPYAQLFDEYRPMLIPEYQRPYRWDIQKAEVLLSDLSEFFFNNTHDGREYYMGSILFYKNPDTLQYEIIDGQQRVTTLILIEFALSGELKPSQHLKYNSHISFHNIRLINDYLSKQKDLLKKLNKKKFLSRLCLTVVISDNEDNAFAFFDSQNNRGVTLSADDYLKAYHLRAVNSETLQEELAQQWESLAFHSQRENQPESSLLHLFYKILYRSRRWRGQKSITPENKEMILETFQKQTLNTFQANSYPLFPTSNNLKYIAFDLDQTDTLIPNPQIITDNHSLPFAIRQPIYKGYHFFQYTQKYHYIHQLLFFKKEFPPELEAARTFYKKIYTHQMSVYLRHYIQLLMVAYYDKFGICQLAQAIEYFDYFIGSIRISKYYVREQAVKNSLLQDIDNNILDVITSAFLSEEIFTFISRQQKLIEIYSNEALPDDDGVRAQYKQRLMGYYHKSEATLKNRLSWIS